MIITVPDDAWLEYQAACAALEQTDPTPTQQAPYRSISVARQSALLWWQVAAMCVVAQAIEVT